MMGQCRRHMAVSTMVWISKTGYGCSDGNVTRADPLLPYQSILGEKEGGTKIADGGEREMIISAGEGGKLYLVWWISTCTIAT